MTAALRSCLSYFPCFTTKILQKLHVSNKLKSWKRRKRKESPSFNNMELSNQFKQVFRFIDANGDGKISAPELGKSFLCLGHDRSSAAKEAEGIVREMDFNGDGFVDLEEFMKVIMVGGREAGAEEEELLEAFNAFDKDRNGFISAEELRRVLVGLRCGGCSIGDCRKMIEGIDRNGDGVVDFEEFKRMMRNERCLWNGSKKSPC